MPDRPVRRERTGWRDEWISRKHREWGYDCPAVDIDFLLIEYDAAQPRALIEYKADGATIDLKNASMLAIAHLANRASIPAFLTIYTQETESFQVRSLNFLGRKAWHVFSPSLSRSHRNWPEGTFLCEQEYVSFLYYLRHRPAPVRVKEQTSA